MAKKRFENCSFLEAIHHAKNGCKIKRKNWLNLDFLTIDIDNIYLEHSKIRQNFFLSLKDFEAQDWIAFTEE
jgi:hypothetical protein